MCIVLFSERDAHVHAPRWSTIIAKSLVYYINYINQIKIVSQYSPRDEEVSLAELEKVGRAPALAFQQPRVAV